MMPSEEVLMIELTEDQRQELEGEQPVRVRDPKTNEVYVLIRQQVYAAIQGILEPFNRAGWNDPALDVYEEYRDQQ
jgi:hypothetical protein